MYKKICMTAFLALILFPMFIPAKAGAAGLTWTSIASELGTVLALDSGGHIWAWGKNYSGEYGDGTTNSVNTPKRVDVLDQGASVAFQKVTLGFNSSVALDSSGHLWTTGDNSNGQLGTGNTTASLVWGKLTVQGSGGVDIVFKDVAAERGNMLALDDQGQLWVWGWLRGYTPEYAYVPVKIGVTDSGTPVSFQSIDAMDENAVALDNRGYIWEINNGAFQPQTKVNVTENGSPVQFKAISAGDTYNCGGWPCNYSLALDLAGNVWAWGNNTKGQLGDGSTLSDITPKKLMVSDSGNPVVFTSISAGDKHALALNSSGTLWTWGFNDSGQLGDGTQIDLYVPHKVTVTDNGNPVIFTAITAEHSSSHAIDQYGQRWAWGGNYSGELGDGTYTGKLLPEKVRFSPAASLSVSPATSTNLEPLTLTSEVTGSFGTPTGTVTFLDGAVVLGSATLDANGKATLNLSSLPAGTHNLTAQYGGDNSYISSLSNPVIAQVNLPAAPVLSIAQSPVDFTFGSKTLSVTAQVYGTGNSLVSLKWLQGDKTAADFNAAGSDILAAKSFDVNRNGNYTVYAKDKAGNETIQFVFVGGIPSTWLTGVSLNGSLYSELEGQNQLIITGAMNHIDAGDPLTLQIDILNSQGTTVTQAVYSIISSGLQQAFNHGVTITSDKFPSGSYTVRVSLSDATRLPNSQTLPFTVNTTSPILQLTMVTTDGKPYASGGWTNQSVTTSVYADVYETSSLASLVLFVDGGGGQPVANNSSYPLSDEGKHTLAYQATDIMGHVFNRTVEVNIDRTLPVIVLNGSSNISLKAGDSYTEQGATASDNFGIAGGVLVSGIVDTQKPGTYTIRYNVNDLAGNAAAEVSRAVTVTAASYGPDNSDSDTAGVIAGPTIPAQPANPPAAPKPEPFKSFVHVEQIMNRLKNALASNRAVSFQDLDSHWAVNDIRLGAKLGIADGYPNGTFMPDAPVTRAEFSKLLMQAFAMTTGPKQVQFKDSRDHWAEESIRILASNEIIDGYEDGSFKPDNRISRAEMVAMLSRISNFAAQTRNNAKTFDDVASSYWAKPFIEEAAGAGLLQGVDDNRFAPGGTTTRAEAMALILRTLKLNPSISELLDSIQL